MKSAAVSSAGKVEQDYKNVSATLDALKDQQLALVDILKELAAAKASAEVDRAAAQAAMKELNDTNTAFVKLNAETQAQHESLVQKQSDMQSKIAEIESANTQIKNLRRVLLETSGDSKSTQDEIASLKTQIEGVLRDASENRDASQKASNDYRSQMEADGTAFEAALNKRFDALHQSLQEKILALLPSAGAAGLASTYYDAKSRYAPTSAAGRLGDRPRTWLSKYLHVSFGYNPASLVATCFFYALFLVPLGIIAWGTYSLLIKVEMDPKFVLDSKMLALRVLIALPLATISTFGFASLRLYRRLFEEYNHKQRVMELYESFRDEVEKNGDKDQQKALLTIMLDSVAAKAWQGTKGDSKDDGQEIFANLDRVADLVEKIKTIGSS